MNTKHFIVLFFNLALLSFANSQLITGLATGALGLGTLQTIALNGALTVPIAAATAGTFATPLAVLGVLKLGAAAAYALGYLGDDYHDDDYYDSGYGYGHDDHHDDHHGHGSSYDFRRRRYRTKRDAVEAPSQEGIFALISSMDSHGCGKQLICELEAKNEAQLEADEQLMLKLFSKMPKNKKVNPANPKGEYILAAELGMATKSQVKCRQRYAACPYTGDEMMAALRNSHI